MKPKQIVIDKCAFQGTPTRHLYAFAAKHWLVLPEILLYECATDENDTGHALLRRFREVILAGAYTCRGCVDIITQEARIRQPYPFLTDINGTTAFRREFKRFPAIRCSPAVKEAYKRTLRGAKVFSDFARDVAVSIRREIPDTVRADLKTLREEDRTILWLRLADSQDMHRFAVERFLRNFTASPGRFCLSCDWVSWQYCRLICALAYEAIFLAEGGGPIGPLRAEHDLSDIEYVLLLSKADAIVTQDKKLVEPLARAAFPEKDVFSSLEEVPESYRCDWTGG